MKLKIKSLNEDYLTYKQKVTTLNTEYDKNINNLEVYIENNILKIKWKDSDRDDWVRNYIVKTENYIPDNIFCGTLLEQYTEKDKYLEIPFTDGNIKANKLYYYRIFTEFGNNADLYSAFKNIFVVYCEDAEEEITFEKERTEIINILQNKNITIENNATWNDINTTINSINMKSNNEFIECYLEGNIYQPPTNISLDKQFYSNTFNFNFSNSIVPNDGSNVLLSTPINQDVYSIQLTSNDLSNILNITDIEYYKLPDISTMDILLQNYDDDSSYINFIGDNFNKLYVSGNSDITFKNDSSTVYYIALNRVDSYCNKCYYKIINNTCIIYWEGWCYYSDHNNKPMDKKWYAVINANGDTSIYVLTTAQTNDFYIKNYINGSNPQYNFPNILNNEQYYLRFSTNIVTDVGIANIKKPISKYILFDNLTQKYKIYDFTNQEWNDINLTAISSTDLQNNGTALPPTDKIRQLTDPILYVYIPDTFLTLKIEYTKINNNLIYNFPITCKRNIRSFNINFNNFNNEKIIFNINGDWKTYINNTWIPIDNTNHTEAFANGIMLIDLNTIKWEINENDKLYFAIVYEDSSILEINEIYINYIELTHINNSKLDLNDIEVRKLLFNMLGYNLDFLDNSNLKLGFLKKDIYPNNYLNIKTVPLHCLYDSNNPHNFHDNMKFWNESNSLVNLNKYLNEENNMIFQFNFENIELNDKYKFINLLYYFPLIEEKITIDVSNVQDIDNVMEFSHKTAINKNNIYILLTDVSYLYLFVIDKNTKSLNNIINLNNFFASNNIDCSNINLLGFNIINEKIYLSIVYNTDLYVYCIDINFSTIINSTIYNVSSILNPAYVNNQLDSYLDIEFYNDNIYIYHNTFNKLLILDNNFNIQDNDIKINLFNQKLNSWLYKTDDSIKILYNFMSNMELINVYDIPTQNQEFTNDTIFNYCTITGNKIFSPLIQSFIEDKLYIINYNGKNKSFELITLNPYSQITKLFDIPLNITDDLLPLCFDLSLTIKIKSETDINNYFNNNNLPLPPQIV